MFDYTSILRKLQETKLSNFNSKIDIVYVLYFYKNIESLVDQLLNIYKFNKKYNFRVVIIINKRVDNVGTPGVSYDELKQLKLPKYVILGIRCYMSGWGCDQLCTGFMRNYYDYVQKLDFKYIIPISQGTYFLKNVDLSTIKEINTKDCEFHDYEKSYHKKFIERSKELKKYCIKNNFQIIHIHFWGSIYTKENVEKIFYFLENSEFSKNDKLKKECIKLFCWPQYLTKSIEYHCCKKIINTGIVKKYFDFELCGNTYPTLEEVKKDCNTFYEELTYYKNKICAARTYVFGVYRIRLDFNDPIKTYIRNLSN